MGLLTELVVRDLTLTFGPTAPFKKIRTVFFSASLSTRASSSTGERKFCRNQRIANLVDVFAQSVAGERCRRLQRERVAHRGSVETGDVDVKRLDARLLAGRDAISNCRANTARPDLFLRFDSGVEVAAVAQVDLNLVSVAQNELLREASAGLDKVQSGAKFINGDRCSGNRSQLNAHVADLHLPLDDETQPDWPSAICAFVDDFDPRIRNASGIKQRLQRLAHAHRRKLRVRRDSQQATENQPARWDLRATFDNQLDRSDLPAFVVFDPRVFRVLPCASTGNTKTSRRISSSRILRRPPATIRFLPLAQNRFLNRISKLKLFVRALSRRVEACSNCAINESRSDTRYSSASI